MPDSGLPRRMNFSAHTTAPSPLTSGVFRLKGGAAYGGLARWGRNQARHFPDHGQDEALITIR